jgi:hypothetical protein
VKHARYYWRPSAEGETISVILTVAGKQGIVSGNEPGRQVVSNALFMQNKVEQ